MQRIATVICLTGLLTGATASSAQEATPKPRVIVAELSTQPKEALNDRMSRRAVDAAFQRGDEPTLTREELVSLLILMSAAQREGLPSSRVAGPTQ